MPNCVRKIVFIGHLTTDNIVFNTGKTSFKSPGGATLYCAGGAALYGRGTCIISAIGTSYNYGRLREAAKQANLDIQRIKKLDNHGLDIWILYDDNNEHYCIPKYYSGTFEEIVPTCDMITEDLLQGDHIFHITPMPIKVQSSIARYLISNNCIVTLDPPLLSPNDEGFQEWIEILPNLHAFFPSEIEFKALGGGCSPHKNPNAIIEFAEHYGVNVLALKLAENGSYLYKKATKELYYAPTACRRIIDCTGAGDAFAGGFIHGYTSINDPIEALGYASVAASFAAESHSAIELLYKNKSQAQQRLYEFSGKVKRLM